MVLTIDPQLEAALIEFARGKGIQPEELALNTLRERFAPAQATIVPQDEWERRLLEIGTSCGVALSHEAVSSEGLYE